MNSCARPVRSGQTGLRSGTSNPGTIEPRLIVKTGGCFLQFCQSTDVDPVIPKDWVFSEKISMMLGVIAERVVIMIIAVLVQAVVKPSPGGFEHQAHPLPGSILGSSANRIQEGQGAFDLF